MARRSRSPLTSGCFFRIISGRGSYNAFLIRTNADGTTTTHNYVDIITEDGVERILNRIGSIIISGGPGVGNIPGYTFV
ncbi:MAG: hypothetical protein U5L72_16925 [Bacteroidales bacterium]|nr:hypothetical protein [Bacteroidales bacterium]